MKQPLLGLVALLLVIICSLGIISLFEEATFSTWVSFLFICCVPAQIVFAQVWHCSIPAAASRLAQPAKGATLTVLTAAVGMVVATMTYYLVGKGQGITPMLLMYAILTVVVTFWYVILCQCWPVTQFSDKPLVIGVSVLLVAYIGAYIVFVLFFDFCIPGRCPGVFLWRRPGWYVHGLDTYEFFRHHGGNNFNLGTV